MAFRPGADAKLLRQLGEGIACHAVGDPDTAFGDEETCGWNRHDTISSLGILLERRYG